LLLIASATFARCTSASRAVSALEVSAMIAASAMDTAFLMAALLAVMAA